VELVTTLREKTSKQLIVQTVYPDDALLTITSKPKLLSWYEKEITERIEFNYPPHTTLIKVVGHVSKTKAAESKEYLKSILETWSPDIYTSPSPEKKDFTRVIALIRVPKSKWWFSQFTKGATIDLILKETLQSLQEKYAVFVNPEDLL
jgi:primosomal protein N'